MNFDCDNIDKLYSLSKLLECKEIRLSAWSQNEGRGLLALFVGGGEFVFYGFTEGEPIIKQVPWFSEAEHSPISICFNQSGTFLLTLSQYGHIYLIPTIPLIESSVKNDHYFDTTDLTIHLYPFPVKKQSKLKAKSPNSSLNTKSNISHSSSSSSSSSDSKRIYSSSTSCHIDSKTNENLIKLKQMKLGKTDIEPTSVVWWQSSSQANKPTAIIGTKTGEIIFVDLSTGVRLGSSSVNGNIEKLNICQDMNYDTSFLLITLENKVQFKVILEQKDLNFSWPGKECSGADDGETGDESQSISKGNYLPTARSRLQGLKQLSVAKVATLKQKLAESRSKPVVKEDNTEEYTQKINNLEPDYVWGRINDIVISPQMSQERCVLAGFHPATQLLSVYTMALDTVPLSTFKMPVDVGEVLLCDNVIFTMSTNKSVIQVISSHVSQIKSSCWDFNPDSVLGKWDLAELSDSTWMSTDTKGPPKPDLIPPNHLNENSEKILGLYRMCPKEEPFDFAEEYKFDRKKEDFMEVSKIENCVVVTNRNVYSLERKHSVIRIALNWILNKNAPEKVEKLCGVFRLNLEKLLELAGDIKLASGDVTWAIAFYKVSECPLLKIVVKLSAAGYCGQLLKYAVPVMSESSFSDMSLTERIHLSNLVLMAYTQQILSREDTPDATEKFLQFLESNPFYDGILAVSVTGQSFLFRCLHKLMIHKGLILDGYTVLIKLIQRFLENKSLQWTINKDDFWACLTENSLIEAMIYKSATLPIYVEYVVQNVESLDLPQLDRLLVLADPTSPYVRSLAYTTKALDDSLIDNDEMENSFPFPKLVELFLVALLVKINKFRDKEGFNRELLLPPSDLPGKTDPSSSTSEDENFETSELSEQIWPIRKDVKESEVLKRKRESVLSCGFGHSALIRNGSVYTWGQTTRGCLGHGPTMSKYSSPSPIIWLGSFRLEVSIVACGKQHTVALTNNGLYSWGCSAYGQLGLGDVRESPHPRLISSLANENIISVKCGQYHTLALTGQGSVFAWGWGVHGQLGLGSIDDERTPREVYTLKEEIIIDIAGGHGHSLVLTNNGHIYSFGSSVYGQLGTGVAMKSTIPVLVKGINGRVVNISTGYFHNLAVTESNALYTWGISPLSLRRRRQKILENEKNTTSPESDAADTSMEDMSGEDPPEGSNFAEKVDAHLFPSVVDTREVKGTIVQTCCGCHHSVLVTDIGTLYVWGRSVGQIENASQRELPKPTLFSFNNMKVDAVACGCEFTTVQDKQTGKIFSWGSNSVGQLGVPVEESATKCLDGKLIMLKSNKRTIRIPQTSTISFLSPREVPDIPTSSFTYHTLNKHSSIDSFSLSHADPEGYSSRCLHLAIEKYRQVYNINFILKKCIELGNYQAASKIALLENKFKQSMIYQLKCLQNLPKYHPKSLLSFEKQEPPKDGTRSPKSEVMTPESEIHLFTEQGGKEELCEDAQSQDISNSEDDISSQKDSEQSNDEAKNQEINTVPGPEENRLNELKTEYVEHAKFILETYLDLCLNHFGSESSLYAILETGIQFWTAEKLPVIALEDLLLQKFDLVYYDLGYLLFCQLKRESQTPILQQFSSSFLLKITSRLVNHVEKNGSVFEYLETMSKIIVNEKPDTKAGKKKRGSRKPESFVQAITEKLKKHSDGENYICVPSGEILSDLVYYFSCGHWHSGRTLQDGFRLFDRISDTLVTDKLLKLYDLLDKSKCADVSCPSCLYNYIKQ